MARKLVTTAALLAVFAAPAIAADIPARMPAKAPPAAVVAYNWSGFYTATTVGGGWQEIDGAFTSGIPHRTRATRFWTGSHVGYQVQLPNRWVIGIEGGYSAPWDKKYATSTTGPDCLTSTANRTCGSRILNVITVGAKVGHAFGNWMAYAAGGYANARIDHFDAQTSTGNWLGSDSRRQDGWYAGAGVDVMVTRVLWSDLILGVEYRHMEFPERFHPANGGSNGKNITATVDTIMAKATFKWVGSGPFGYFFGR